MSKPTEAAYWEKFARDIGWNDAMVQEAGEVGSLAVSRGMSPDEAIDVVLTRVRDRKNVRIGPNPVVRFLRNPGTPAFFCGLVTFLAAGVGREDESVATIYPIVFSSMLALQFFLFIGGVTKRQGWKLAVLGLAMSASAVAVAVAPSTFKP